MEINYFGKAPTRANANDAGNDLYAFGIKRKKRYIEYYTRTHINIPKGYVGLLCPRSSTSDYDLFLANGVGVIDSGFIGEIRVRYKVIPTIWNLFGLMPKKYKVGDKIAQLIIMPFEFVDWHFTTKLEETERGEKGFGSSS